MVLVPTSQCGDIMKHEHRREQWWWWWVHQYLDTGTTPPPARISLAEKTAAVTKYTAVATRQPGTGRCHADRGGFRIGVEL